MGQRPKSIYEFDNRHPTVKMLALSFLMLIGMMLSAEDVAVAFSVFLEMVNIRSRKGPGAGPAA